jgi:GntR family transcriptional regulator
MKMTRKANKFATTDKKLPKKSKSPPINAVIYSTLRNRIVGNEYSDTGFLPPELTLMEEFGVSRHTIRTSLQKLVNDGLIERKRGTRTTIVQRDMMNAVWAASSLDHIHGKFHEADILFAGAVRAKQHPDMATVFGLGNDDALFQVAMILKSKEGPISYSVLFTRMEFGKRVPKEMISTNFFLNLLERYAGVRAVRARQVASAAMPSAEASKALGIRPDQPIVVLNRSFINGSGEVIEHGIMHCQPDTYPQIVNFYRQDDIARRL